mmetsp:Transcript_62522/g.111097  ORF Transcript_62522/g.111097 Transcript_62522/m.111097 type:complete len:247 (-) Transcript_62522:405-1145(-)
MKTPTTIGVLRQAFRKALHLAASALTASSPFLSMGGEEMLAERSPKRRTASATVFACSTDAWRFDLAKMTPMRLAPAPMAQLASSSRTTPQTLTNTSPGDTGSASSPSDGPIIARMAAPGSAARIKASPTRMPLQPISRQCVTSSAVERPLSARSFVASFGPKATLNLFLSSAATSAVLPLSSSKVWRLRLFTPMTRAPASRATSSSFMVTTSTNGSMPCSRQQAMRARSLDLDRMETIKRAVSAP